MSFTPDDEQTIEALADQINVTEHKSGANVTLNMAMVNFAFSMGATPSLAPMLTTTADAATPDEALDIAQTRITEQIDRAAAEIEAWLGRGDEYRHQIAMRREALRRAIEALKREPS